jgi:hypothetical protein
MAFGTRKELQLSTTWRKDFGRNKEKRLTMTKQFLKDTLSWGFALWLIGYILGILFFAIVPHSLIGWVIMPIGIFLSLWVLLKKIKLDSFYRYVLLGIAWAVIAIICDYFFLVKIFKPTDGYYKPDVYLYYALTFILPVLIGWKKILEK